MGYLYFDMSVKKLYFVILLSLIRDGRFIELKKTLHWVCQNTIDKLDYYERDFRMLNLRRLETQNVTIFEYLKETRKYFINHTEIHISNSLLPN